MTNLPPIELLSLLEKLPQDLLKERFETLLESPSFRLERILSWGHATPEGEWYDQEWDEWVLLLLGAARLVIEGQMEEVIMNPGDGLLLPAHCRHRVAWAAPDRITVWLALHFRADGCQLTPA